MKKFMPFMLAIAIALSTVAVPVFAEDSYKTSDTDKTIKTDDNGKDDKDTDKSDKSKSDKKDKSDANANIPLSAETLLCVQIAVDTRDTALLTAIEVDYTATKLALETRKTALKAAWALSTAKERKNAISKAWKEYKTALKSSNDTLKKARKTAWNKFKDDFKICKGITEGELNSDKNSEGSDVLLQNKNFRKNKSTA